MLDKIASGYAATGSPITLVLDNARYQKCQSVFDKAEALGIELLYLPAYSPNLNLIERLWRFVKKQVLYSGHYDKFAAFKDSIDNCLRDLGTRFKYTSARSHRPKPGPRRDRQMAWLGNRDGISGS